jgi:putative addiction module component (TIGR02574 family)
MSMTREQLLAEAMALEPREREALAGALLATLSESDARAIDEAWLAESLKRDAAYARGEVTAAPVDEVIERVRSRTHR